MLGSISAYFRHLPIIFKFPKIISLKFFGKSYTMLFAVDLKYSFTCGESIFLQNVAKFQNKSRNVLPCLCSPDLIMISVSEDDSVFAQKQ